NKRPRPIQPRKARLQLESLEERIVLDNHVTFVDPGVQHVQEGQSISLQVSASAADGADLTFNGSVPAGLTISSSGLITGMFGYDSTSVGLTTNISRHVEAITVDD